jgi:Arc/MetJ-type ribon-helix-helix transcriptional regulator
MLQLNLPPALEKSLTDRVNPEGFYPSAEDVVCAGLALLDAETEALREALRVGIADADAGRFCDKSIEELIEEAKREFKN